jgi:hypothetical protein
VSVECKKSVFVRRSKGLSGAKSSHSFNPPQPSYAQIRRSRLARNIGACSGNNCLCSALLGASIGLARRYSPRIAKSSRWIISVRPV